MRVCGSTVEDTVPALASCAGTRSCLFALQGDHLVRAPGPAASGVAAGQATSLCEDPEGFVCTTRTRASAAKYLDIDYPDVFVFLADA